MRSPASTPRTGAAATPLAGLRIAVTRGADDCADWAAKLAELGAEPIVFPCIRTETAASADLEAALAAARAAADWLVFTSRRGVEAYAALRPNTPTQDAAGAGRARAKVAVVGPATAAAASELLGRVDFVAEGGTAAALGAELPDSAAFGAAPRCVLAVAENAGPALEDALTRAGASCRRFDVYRTVPASAGDERTSLAALGADIVLFASPSAVTGFLNRVGVDAPLTAVAIGPSTSAALAAAGLAVAAEARAPSLDSMLDSILDLGLVAARPQRAPQAESRDV